MTLDDAAGLLVLPEVVGWLANEERSRRRLGRLLDHPDYHARVAESDGQLIGFATGQLNWMIQVDEPVAELTGLAVLPSSQGVGIGTALVRAFEAWGAAAGAVRLKVTSGDHRRIAHDFYEHRGYARSGVRFHKIQDGG